MGSIFLKCCVPAVLLAATSSFVFAAASQTGVDTPNASLERTSETARQATSPLRTLLSDNAVAETENCIYARNVRSVEILDERAIVLRGSHDRYWLNEFRHKCAGLRKNMTLSLSRYGSQICANDRVQAQERGDIGPIASCRLGKFQPVAEEQVASLKAELDGAR